MESSLRLFGHFILICYLLRFTNAVTPVFQSSNTPPHIKDGLPPNTFYFQFKATDASGHPITYRLDSKASEWFHINSSTGNATIKKTIDREVMGGLFRYEVFATDGTNEAQQDIIQTIIDINDSPPVFTNLPKTVNVAEDFAVNTVFFTVSATDADDPPNNQITYSIESGNENGLFSFENPADGDITLKKPLDFDEGPKQFVLRIFAINADSPSMNATSELTINVSDVDDLGAKFLKNSYEATIVKNSPVGAVVTTVQAEDGDSFNATVEYAIYQETNPGNVYIINNKTGEISVNGPLSIGEQVLVVTAKSTNQPLGFTIVKVKVASMINMSYTIDVVEGQSDVNIFSLEPAERFYNISGGIFSIIRGGSLGLFAIDGNNLKLGSQPLDRETKNQYQLTIELKKDGTFKGMIVVTIKVLDVNDNKPLFQGDLPYNGSVREDADIGQIILNVTADDLDKELNGTVKYAIIGGNPSGLFSIDNTTGVISLAGSLDRENTAQYTLTIQAYDGGSPPMTNTTSLIINVRDVNDNSPVMNQTSFTKTLSEWATNGTQVVEIVATDADIGNNGRITYAIQEGADGKFVIDPITGVMSTTGGLSYSTKPTYTIIVNARDHGLSPRSATAVVTVIIKPKTNKTYNVQATEGSTNVVVMNLLIVEQDYNITGASFSISAGNDDSHFQIDSSSLKIGSQPLDREQNDDYQLRITLEKDGRVRGVAMVNVKVLDINDNKPSFQGSIPYNITVKEDTGIGENILNVTATDNDDGANGTIRYIITAGNVQGSFNINNITGEISISKKLDRENTTQYNLTVQAYDGGSPPMTGTTNVIINVKDVNDNPPVFMTPTVINVNVSEDAESNTQVVQVTANDADEGENSRITYEIRQGSDGKFFIDQDNGIIKTTGGLSYKQKSKYTVIVKATDHGAPPRVALAFVDITLIMNAGVNQHSPVFEQSEYLGGVYKDTSDGQRVLTVKATDADSGINGEVTYDLTDNPVETLLYLDDKTGHLQTANSFVGREGELFILKAQAKDKGVPPKDSVLANICVFVLQESYSMVITSGLSQDNILKNLPEFRGVLDYLTGGKAFIKSVRPKDGGASIIFNVVKNKTELTSSEIKRLLDERTADIRGTYSKWELGIYEAPKVGARTSSGGLSAVVGAMICLALLIGVGGIIMIVILIKKRREREKVRKSARVTFNDKPLFINIDGNLPVSKRLCPVESAQEAQEGIANVPDDTSSVGSEEEQSGPDVLNCINQAYKDEDDDENDQSHGFFADSNTVNFGTFFPPPPTEPPPPVPDSDAGDSVASEEESINSDEDPDYINAVLPPHEDFADTSHRLNTIQEHDEDSPTPSRSDTSQLINPSSYKDHLLRDPTFEFAQSSNPEQTTEL